MVRTGNKPWFDDQCILAHCAKQRAYRVGSCSRMQAGWKKHRGARHHAQLIYEDAERLFMERSKSLLTNAPNQWKWWSPVKTAVFGASSFLPPLVDRGGKLAWSVDEKISLFSVHFAAKQCRGSFQLPHSWDRSPILWGWLPVYLCS